MLVGLFHRGDCFVFVVISFGGINVQSIPILVAQFEVITPLGVPVLPLVYT